MSRRKHKNETAQKWRDSDVDRASDASFPASDPPPWTLGSAEPTVAPPPPVPAPPLSVVSTLPGLGPPNLQGAAEIAADFDVTNHDRRPPSTTAAVTATPRRPVGDPPSLRQRLDTRTLARL